ncbi:MAG: MBL fold metallo-hydrolase [Burkholderiaceae bacterium]
MADHDSSHGRWRDALAPVRAMVLGLLLLVSGPLAAHEAKGAPVADACPVPSPAGKFEPVSVKLQARKLTDRVWFVQGMTGMVSPVNQGFNSNAGFVVTDDGVVVFDALGTPSLGEALFAEIRKVTDKPVRRVIISHYHSDHFYGAQPFAEAGIEVWAQNKVLEYLRTEAPAARLEERRSSLFPWVDERARVTPPDLTFDRELVFRLGGMTFHLMHVGPAHTPEDIMMYVEEEDALFAGDLVFAGRLPWVGTADSRAWLAALDELAKREARVVITGHGPASTDAMADLNMTREYLRFLRQEMGKAVADLLPFDEAYEQVDWSAYEKLPTFDEGNRRNAYNTYLRMEREALGGGD